MAALGSILFFFAAPGTVAGLIPWWISRWQTRDGYPLALRVLGGVLLAMALGILILAFVQFVVEGLGTPAPVAETKTLVVGGIYRYVRNPMYVAIDSAIFAQALLFGQGSLAWYGALITLVQAGFVKLYEEQRLRERFGPQYDEYRQAVPGWWPRLRPWTPESAARS